MKIFGTAGIRGLYPHVVNPFFALRLGVAIGKLGLSKRSLVVYDTRKTSPLLSYSLISGLLSTGMEVVMAGLAPTPVVAYGARKHRGVGISVTASHNPPEYNGFKLYDPEGYEFTRSLEARIEEFLGMDLTIPPWYEVAEAVWYEGLRKEYLEDILGRLKTRGNELGSGERSKYRVVVDCAGGATYQLAPLIVKELGGKPLNVNCSPDPDFVMRSPEPRKDVLESFFETYISFKPLAVFALDGDGDRLSVLDPKLGFIRQDRLLALFAKLILPEKKGRIIVSIDTGRVVDEVVEQVGGTVERYVLGKTHERVKELGEENVAMAGEPWKLIDTRWGPWVDGLWQLGLLTSLIIERGKTIGEILLDEKIPDYPWGRVSYLIEPSALRDKMYFEVVEELKGELGEPARIIDIDGTRFEYPDESWVLVRKSGTEPKLRFYFEAKNRDRIFAIERGIDRIITRIAEKMGAKIISKTIG